METFSPVLAQRLKELRQSKELSLADLSNTLHQKYNISISKDSLANYEVATESNHSRKLKNQGMSVKNLRCLADFYQVSTDYLLGIVSEPSRDGDMQATCEFTGLSNNSVKTIRELDEYPLEVLNCLLEEPFIYSFFLSFYALARDKSVMENYRKAMSLIAKSSLNIHDFTEKFATEFPYSERYEVGEYRLVKEFKHLLDSIVNKLIERKDFQEYGAAIFENEFCANEDDIRLLKNLIGNCESQPR